MVFFRGEKKLLLRGLTQSSTSDWGILFWLKRDFGVFLEVRKNYDLKGHTQSSKQTGDKKNLVSLK